jgi:hypothetical protein
MNRMDCALEGIARSREDNAILPLLRAILDDFHREKIHYCYWKSSSRVADVLSGEADLDLLVAKADQHRTEALLLARGCKRFPSTFNRDHPSVVSFLGFDEPSGRLIHLHVHFRLVVGEPLLKNYRIPWEELVLGWAIPHASFPIRLLDPTTEALLLEVRASLELRRLDPINLKNWRAINRKFVFDRAELAPRVDPTLLRNRATELLGEGLADLLVDAVWRKQSGHERRRLRRYLRAHFAVHRMYNSVEARVRSAWRAVLFIAGDLNKRFLHLPRPWSRRTPGGGSVVAFTGVDGSGKSTITAAMSAWLSPELDVMPIYFGTGAGRPSLLLLPVKLLVPLARRVIKTKPKGASHGKISSRPPGALYSALLTVWATSVAIEKRIKLSAAHRGAARGLLVLADRYPQNEIPRYNDGPLLPRLARVPHWLRRFEAGAYTLARRLPPDLVIKLVVLPATSARREPDMDPAVIEERVGDLQRLAFPGARVVCVDAEQPLADVIRIAKREVWRQL